MFVKGGSPEFLWKEGQELEEEQECPLQGKREERGGKETATSTRRAAEEGYNRATQTGLKGSRYCRQEGEEDGITDAKRLEGSFLMGHQGIAPPKGRARNFTWEGEKGGRKT